MRIAFNIAVITVSFTLFFPYYDVWYLWDWYFCNDRMVLFIYVRIYGTRDISVRWTRQSKPCQDTTPPTRVIY